MDTRAVICLDLLPESVYYRRYFHKGNSRTILEHCVAGISREASCDVCVLAFDEDSYKNARVVLGPDAHRVRRAATTLELPAVLAVASDGVRHVLIFRLECLLAPVDLPRRLLEVHTATGNAVTWIEGAPVTITPMVFTTSGLEGLLSLELPGLGRSCISTLETIRRAGAGTITAAIGCTASGIPIESLCPGYESLVIPVVADCAEDVRRILAVVEEDATSTAADASSWGRLQRWRAITVQENDRVLRDLTARAGSVQEPRLGSTSRVLYVSNASGFSGAEQSLLQLIRHLPEDYQKYALVAMEGELTDFLRAANVCVICPQREFAAPSVRNVLYSTAVLRDIRPDIVHLNGRDGVPIVSSAQVLGIPIVMHVRNGTFQPYYDYAATVDRFIAVSDYVRRGIASMVSNPQSINVIRDEVDAQVFHPNAVARVDARQGFQIPIDAFVVGMIARFDPNKGHDIVLRAVQEAKRRVPGMWLFLVGEIYEHPDVFAAVQAVGETSLADCFRWIPFVRDIRRVHAALDVLVLCSHGEGLGRCVVEAMAMAIPVVVSRQGGVCEIVNHGSNGVVVDVDAPAALASALVELAENSAIRARYGRAAREFVLAHLTAASSAEAVAKIYRDVLANRQATTSSKYKRAREPAL